MTRGVLDQVPRSSLLLLLVAQAGVILPHLTRLSPWVIAVWMGCVAWRVQIYRGLWPYPARWVKLAAMLVAAVGVAVEHGQLHGLEPAVALLVVAFLLKLLEMSDRRDALVVIYLGYFVLATEFLFDQRLAKTAYQLAVMVLLTASLVALNQSWQRPRPGASLREATVLVLQAVPLAVVVFLFFPRIAPLWAVPLPGESARTGIPEAMELGEVASLARSDELAFRVRFDGEMPPPAQRYWRVLTYSRYRDGTWLPPSFERGRRWVDWAGGGTPSWVRQLRLGGDPTTFEVLFEPTQRPWLATLTLARPQTPGVGLGRDFRLLAADPVTQRLRYRARWWPRAALDPGPGLPGWLASRETAIPEAGNPATRALARRLAAQHEDPRALVRAVLAFFREQPFVYTLDPPLLQGARIDDFLFRTRSGFCEHYAGAFVYLMRVAGVPARVVGGYQGGERNPVGDHLLVRSYDAHAWAEIWIEGRGWERVDPTTAVAPSRITRGAEAALTGSAGSEGSALEGGGLRRWGWVRDAFYFVDSIEHRWNLMVLEYDAGRQSRVLEDLLGEITPLRVALGAGLGGLLAVALVTASSWLPRLRRRRRGVLRLADELDAAFAGVGLPRTPAETPRRYGERLARAWPELGADVRTVTEAVQRGLFDPDAAAAPAGAGAALARLRRRLRWYRLRRELGRGATGGRASSAEAGADIGAVGDPGREDPSAAARTAPPVGTAGDDRSAPRTVRLRAGSGRGAGGAYDHEEE